MENKTFTSCKGQRVGEEIDESINMLDNANDVEVYDVGKESMLTAEVYKRDKRIKSVRYTKNKIGLKYIDSFDFSDMTEEDIIDRLSESWSPERGYSFTICKTYVKRKNIMSGEMFYERYDTPSYCSPSSESYWSM